MRNLSVLRDCVCAISTDVRDIQQSRSARLCADSDTGNVYVADVTHGSVYCLSSNSQVGCCGDPSPLLVSHDPSAFRNHQTAIEQIQVSFAQLPYSAGPLVGKPAAHLGRRTWAWQPDHKHCFLA